MDQVLSVWSALSVGRRVVVVLATVAVFATVLTLGRLASQPSMALLYAGLEPQAAADVVAALEAQGAAFDVRGNALYVEAARRDALRMTLAGDGLPSGGSQGYELLDNLTGFGTTAQMFDAAYWRAKEGELARTITASPHVRSARVHIANPASRPFQRDQPASASVTVTAAGGGLSMAHAKALRFLVASAVTGLAPENVTVIDAEGGLVASDDAGERSGVSGEDRAETLKKRVERLLEARVGYGNAVVEVSLETELESEQIVERVIDPDSRVAISTETVETTTRSNDTRAGAVTVASNLPDGDVGSGGGAASSSNSETRELTNFEISETQREVIREPGATKRVTVAVLVDGVRELAADGSSTWAARPDTELDALRSLVASAVGFDAARGDEITIHSLEFEQIVPEGSPPPVGLIDRLALDVMSLIQMGVLALVALVLGLFVVRPILASGAAGPVRPVAELAPPPPGPDPAPMPALDGEIQTGGGLPDLPDLPDLANLPDIAPAGSGVVDRLKQMISDREAESAEILRNWVEEPREVTR
ncbi:MAG: flagellar basal-body MS-ring/collar protein FliF [Paracoccaceae bacterium]|nr:flagellar basal-body MS-ring/collar protein FliF [Paracoccaceae bacterium]